MMNGIELFRYQSAYDPSRECVVLLHFGRSRNIKTGRVATVYFLDANRTPTERDTNKVSSTCGTCPFRWETKLKGSPACYVNRGQYPNQIWQAWKRGNYPKYHEVPCGSFNKIQKIIREECKGIVRLGGYGDIASLSENKYYILRAMLYLLCAKEFVGYTHGWHLKRCEYLKGTVMASCYGIQEVSKAMTKGWKTFQIVDKNPNHCDSYDATECVNQKTEKIQCKDCKLCNGSKAHVWIQAH